MLTQQEYLKIYNNSDSEKLLNLARFDSKKLTEPAIIALKGEILKRQLGTKLIDWINAERNFFKGFELEILKTKIKYYKCSNCKIKKNNIKGFYIHNCSLTHNPKEANLLLCEECGKKFRNKNYIISATWGWLSSKGFINVPFYFLNEVFNIPFRKKQSEKIFKEFIFENTGLIRHLGIDKIEKIVELHNNHQLSLEIKEDFLFLEFL
ncbi:hypothetical protein [Chryseobacterium indoltheticum]|uniref:Uncharacterized protein n=1 Tax=Chryseobacterium indoltheticum TaxID=254 RepID=A0A3G6N4H4_9FLAO|nr:hypothetical protein [Chryseobacterium indoltheticum]AZA61338.1 hypothetical protein EG340_09945 [Chryseobacterium indoltheticum]